MHNQFWLLPSRYSRKCSEGHYRYPAMVILTKQNSTINPGIFVVCIYDCPIHTFTLPVQLHMLAWPVGTINSTEPSILYESGLYILI